MEDFIKESNDLQLKEKTDQTIIITLRNLINELVKVVDSIKSKDFQKIISTDNEVCKYTKNSWANNRVTCIGFAKKCNNFNAELY